MTQHKFKPKLPPEFNCDDNTYIPYYIEKKTDHSYAMVVVELR